MEAAHVKLAFEALLSVANDAVELAEHACASADAPAQRSMVKVAADRCIKVAHAVVGTGVIDESPESLAQAFSDGDPHRLIDVLEKLASRAMYPVFIEDAGDLVDKPASEASLANDAGDSPGARWRRAHAETKRELAAGKR